ncbi:hypothetical protein M3202_21945, partial [Alkalihalobacillus oceani]|nr:hypothetical protein [Halalkalibacter oceani]
GTDTGGIIGEGTAADFKKVYATGEVEGENKVGGLIGEARGAIEISDGFSAGNVKGSGDSVGGAVGYLGSSSGTPRLENVYAVGSVEGKEEVGGIVGYHRRGSIQQVFALNPFLAGESHVGKVIGSQHSSGDFEHTYSHDRINGGGKTDFLTGLITEDNRKNFAFYKERGLDEESWLFSSTIGLPVLRGLPEPNIQEPIYEETVTLMSDEEGIFIPIRTVSELEKIGSIGSETRYKLLNNIDLSSVENWEPLPRFDGVLEGNGHTIFNLTIEKNESDVGLFRSVGSDGVIKNLTLQNVNVKGGEETGALTGSGSGTIEGVSVIDGLVSGEDMTGGIAGSWSGAMTESYSSVDVKGGTDTGGIIGEGTAADFKKVYATGEVEGENKVGGLIGEARGAIEISDGFSAGNVKGSGDSVGGAVGYLGSSSGTPRLENVYAVGSVEGKEEVGGIVGYHRRGSIQQVFALNP